MWKGEGGLAGRWAGGAGDGGGRTPCFLWCVAPEAQPSLPLHLALGVPTGEVGDASLSLCSGSATGLAPAKGRPAHVTGRHGSDFPVGGEEQGTGPEDGKGADGSVREARGRRDSPAPSWASEAAVSCLGAGCGAEGGA